MNEKEEQELIEKGLRYRPTIKEARTYIVDENGNEIRQTNITNEESESHE